MNPIAVIEKHKQIQSIIVGFSILKALADHKGEMTLNEISKATQLHKSQLYRYLNSFVELGVLIKHEGDIPRWSLGPELIALGAAALEGMDVAKEAAEPLMALRDVLNETVALSIWRERGPYFISWVRSKRPVNIGLDTGYYVPLYSVTGRIFRAYLPEYKTRALYEKEKAEGLIDPEKYDAEIEQVRKMGYTSTQRSFYSGVAVISAPIFSASGELAGALSVLGVSGRLDTSPSSEAVKELLKTVELISRRLGYTGAYPPLSKG